ncbi:lysylphosphatidylglycerol synthase transmembrane domain-containing protein [Novosphingobium sp. BL-8H]|uniref:lysylphosphatidylglycerol synthase transmembrane domain-containing protein n=1 Tax=Novosphingobium sp. BL-8H TaxID=3127640 RepID=UPI003756E3A8
MSDQHGRPAGAWRSWFFGIVVIAALVGTVAHWGEVTAFGTLIHQARPGWLGLAIAFQISTYASLALGWSQVLAAAGTPRKLAELMRIAITKLFADQVLPSAGMGGNVLLVDQLRGIGVARGAAVAALLISMIGFYAAYAFFAVVMLALLWRHDHATPIVAGLVTVFLCVAVAIPGLALWLRDKGSKRPPEIVEKIGFARKLLETVAQAPDYLLRNHALLVRVTFCNAMIFLADAGTLFACLRALGTSPGFSTCFIAVIMASIVVTLGPIPLGLGTFEATSTATLHLLGVPFEAAFAGTMMFRVLTLWLPLVPGMVLMRGVLGHRHGAGK